MSNTRNNDSNLFSLTNHCIDHFDAINEKTHEQHELGKLIHLFEKNDNPISSDITNLLTATNTFLNETSSDTSNDRKAFKDTFNFKIIDAINSQLSTINEKKSNHPLYDKALDYATCCIIKHINELEKYNDPFCSTYHKANPLKSFLDTRQSCLKI